MQREVGGIEHAAAPVNGFDDTFGDRPFIEGGPSQPADIGKQRGKLGLPDVRADRRGQHRPRRGAAANQPARIALKCFGETRAAACAVMRDFHGRREHRGERQASPLPAHGLPGIDNTGHCDAVAAVIVRLHHV